jgi:hypothetical protein
MNALKLKRGNERSIAKNKSAVLELPIRELVRKRAFELKLSKLIEGTLTHGAPPSVCSRHGGVSVSGTPEERIVGVL